MHIPKNNKLIRLFENLISNHDNKKFINCETQKKLTQNQFVINFVPFSFKCKYFLIQYLSIIESKYNFYSINENQNPGTV